MQKLELEDRNCEGGADMETQFHVHFSPLCKTVYEWVDWMWRMSQRSGVDVENEQRSGCGQYLKRIRFCLHLHFFP